MTKALDDAMIALYQNGERIDRRTAIRCGCWYRLRRQYECKWLHRIKLIEEPVDGDRSETVQYTYRVAGPEIGSLLSDGGQILRHAPIAGLTLKEPGFYEIAGLAYSGNGRIAEGHGVRRRRQELGRGGARRAGAEQGADQVPHALALGRPAGRAAKSSLGRSRQRAADARTMFAERGAPKVNVPVTAFPMGHMNVITSWSVDNKGEVKHVYA